MAKITGFSLSVKFVNTQKVQQIHIASRLLAMYPSAAGSVLLCGTYTMNPAV
jgi:hypothetical protein